MPLPSEIGIQPVLDYIRELIKSTNYIETDAYHDGSKSPFDTMVYFTRKEPKSKHGGVNHWKRLWIIGSKVHYYEGFFVTIMLAPFKPLTNGADTYNAIINLCEPDSLEKIKNLIERK